MRKVVLLFPDTVSISEFLLMQKVSRVIIDTGEKMLRGILTDAQLHIACKQYGAKIRSSSVVKTKH